MKLIGIGRFGQRPASPYQIISFLPSMSGTMPNHCHGIGAMSNLSYRLLFYGLLVGDYIMEKTTGIFDALLAAFPVSRIRRNHGLEHATLHVLARQFPKLSLAGHSDMGGFWVLGEVETEDLRTAIDEGLQRMRDGEEDLAVHPNCGTNFVTAGTFAGVAASLALMGSGRGLRDRLERVPLAASLATVALMLAQPLGLLIQERVTTSGRPDTLRVVRIVPSRRGRIRAHRVVTEG
jgi:hypothetical protein